MKPRFSILTLLGITAYVAVNVAAYAQPSPILSYLQFSLVALIVLLLIVVAAGKASSRVVFARAFLAAIVSYSVLQNWEPTFHPLDRGILNFWNANLYADQPMMSPENMMAAYRSAEIITINVQMVFGLICGGTALWRYRRLERRENRPNP